MDFFDRQGRSDWIQIETLIRLRWLAGFGQIAAILATTVWFGITIAIGPVILVVGALIVVNLLAQTLYPRTARPGHTHMAAFLIFDTVQLGALVAMTGGLSNPFVMLILAPIVVGSTVLPFRSALVVAAVGIVMTTAMGVVYFLPLDAQGVAMEMHGIHRFGMWASLVIGILFLGVYARQVSIEINTMAEALVATQSALMREQKLTDIGGVVAAAAHELGTPLATIKLVSTELADLLAHDPDLREDAELIVSQADRCRDILREMGQAGKGDRLLQQAPLQALVEEAAAPHRDRGKQIDIVVRDMTSDPGSDPYLCVHRTPEILHGLRNLVQNAVDFAETAVEIRVQWDERIASVRVHDDGPGYPVQLIDRLGDPMLWRRPNPQPDREGYDGMGLGLFIAKTLLGRTGARLSFANGTGERQGAIAEARWKTAQIACDPGADRKPLGDNRPLGE